MEQATTATNTAQTAATKARSSWSEVLVRIVYLLFGAVLGYVFCTFNVGACPWSIGPKTQHLVDLELVQLATQEVADLDELCRFFELSIARHRGTEQIEEIELRQSAIAEMIRLNSQSLVSYYELVSDREIESDDLRSRLIWMLGQFAFMEREIYRLSSLDPAMNREMGEELKRRSEKKQPR